MKTAEKILIAIGAVTVMLAAAAVTVRLICSRQKKYYPVSRTVIEL
jgi:hypothetical protein